MLYTRHIFNQKGNLWTKTKNIENNIPQKRSPQTGRSNYSIFTQSRTQTQTDQKRQRKSLHIN